MLGVERLRDRLEAALLEVLRVDVDREAQALAVVAHVHLEAAPHLLRRHLLALERRRGGLRELLEDAGNLLRVGLAELADEGARGLVAQRRRRVAERAQHARSRRDDRRPGAEQARERIRVQRPRAAEGDQRVVARVVALLDGHEPQRADHVLVDDVVDALRRVLERLAERRRDLADRLRRELAVEFEVAAEALHRRQVAEHDVRVRHRRFRAAAAVGRRARVRARGLRADAQRLGELRHVRDRAAARADRADVDRGGAHGHVADRRLAPQARHAVHDERDVGRGAADVHGEQVRESRLQRDPQRAGDAARGARHQQVHRVFLGRGRGREAAVRTQDVQLHVAGLRCQLAREVAHVALHDRAHVGVRDGRHRALVLLHLRHDLGGERHRHARQHRARDLADAPLVRVVREGIDQRDGERLDLRVLQLRERVAQRRLVERCARRRRAHPRARRPRW